MTNKSHFLKVVADNNAEALGLSNEDLRLKAEELLKRTLSQMDSFMSEADLVKLVHELQVYQIELEMQNTELYLAQEKFQIVADNAFNWEFWEGNDGLWIHNSPSCERITGYAADKFLNDNSLLLRIIHPDDREGYLNHHLEKKTHKSPGTHYFRIIRADGEIRHLEHFCQPVFNAANVYLGIRGTNIDITERKRSEEQLIESEVQFRNLANAGSALIWKAGTDKLCNYFNEPWLKFTGRTLAQELGNGWAENVHPEDLHSCIETYLNAFDKQESFEMEYRLLHADGEYRWILDMGTPNFNSTGTFLGYIGHCFDITERRLIEDTHTFLISCGLPGTGEDFFYSLARYLAKTLNMEYVCIDQLDGEGLMAQTVAIFNEGRFESNVQYALKDTPCGEVVDKSICCYRRGVSKIFPNDEALQELNAESYIGTTLIDSKGRAIGLIAIIGHQPLLKEANAKTLLQLVASRAAGELERREAENALKSTMAELKTSQEKAIESDRLKSAFLANMSHEIRTPMNGILGFSNLLGEPELATEMQQEYIAIIQKSGVRMLNIINEIMDISKIEADLVETNIQGVQINHQINYVHKFQEPTAQAKKITLTLKMSLPDREALILTDEEKFYAILSNLVRNAIKYTDEGSIEFGYDVVEMHNSASLLQFYVKDTGIGIKKERQEAIFERFIQADVADVQARQGAGLGLSIAKAYVEMLGGRIWVESEPKIGSTFYFTLPYLTLKGENEFVDEVISAETPNDQITNLKILVAEDDEVSDLLLSITLKDFCKQIIVSRTGRETVEACRNNPSLDLILMDIQMPDLNGYEATMQIREFNKKVIIIAQTAFGLSGDREHALAAGCNDYLSKPIDKAELHCLIKKYFENYSS